MTRTAISACRLCAGRCAIELTLDENDRIEAVRGHKDDPLTRGYTCIKGLNLPAMHYSPDRLLHPLERQPDGSFRQVSLDTALDRIAERLNGLIDESGPDSVACFKGTLSYGNFLANALMPAFMQAIGSRAFYSTMTIDQSAKWVTAGRLGSWAADKDSFAHADVSMLVGNNPFVSLSSFSVESHNPVKAMRDAKARGLKLIVIDPRYSETARHADLFLQPLPGEDSVLLAGILREILKQGWHDAAFCAAHVDGLDGLRAAVAPFTLDVVDARAGIDPDLLVEAAQMFAEPIVEDGIVRRRRGVAGSGTGPDMGPHSNLAEHLLECLNVVCGRFARAGDPVPNPGVLGAPRPRRAEVIAPTRPWESGPRDARGHGMIYGERMTAVLADQILSDAPDRVRALIVDGGNPANAIPDTARVEKGLSALDLLVVIDPFLSTTAQLADYVIPPRMMLERLDANSRDYEPFTLFVPYSHYNAKVIEPPADSDVIDDWLFFWELARRMDRRIMLDGVEMDMNRPPEDEALMAFLLRRSNVPFDVLKNAPGGHIFDVAPMSVEEGEGNARFAIAPPDIVAELAELMAESPADAGFTHRFAVRRLREVLNTTMHRIPAISCRVPANHAYLHPDDMAAIGVADGDAVLIRSAHGRIEAVAQGDDAVRPGVLSMAHGWGPLPSGGDAPGVNVNLLIDAVKGADPINAMPVMTGFPVRVERAAGRA